MILVIDNYDSFTYNIVQYVGEISGDVIVLKNDDVNYNSMKDMNCSHIIILVIASY